MALPFGLRLFSHRVVIKIFAAYINKDKNFCAKCCAWKNFVIKY